MRCWPACFGRTAGRAGTSLRRWLSCSAMVRVTSWSSTTSRRQCRPGERPGTAFKSCTPSYLHGPGKPVLWNKSPAERLDEVARVVGADDEEIGRVVDEVIEELAGGEPE